MKFYTGVGSRNTPQPVQALLEEIARELGDLHFIGRSGGAVGADSAFERGAHDVSAPFEAYVPWSTYESCFKEYTVCVNDLPNVPQAREIAARLHPNWDNLQSAAKGLHTRNVYQVLGQDLNTPSELLICYAPPYGNSVKGGTATAVNLALEYGIPVFNVWQVKSLENLCKKMDLMVDF